MLIVARNHNKMAMLREVFVLCHLQNEKDLIAVSDGDEADEVIITCANRGIHIYKISNQKLLQSWCPLQGHHFTTSAIWNSSSQQIMAIQDTQILRVWAKDEINFEKSKKMTVMKSPVHKIFLRPNSELIVVYKNGIVEFFNSDKKGFTNALEKLTIKWCGTVECQPDVCVSYVAESETKEFTLHVLWFLINQRIWKTHVDILFSDNGALLDCCWQQQMTDIKFYTLWSSKNLCSSVVSPELGVMPMQTVLHLSSIGGNAAMRLVSSTHLAVAGVMKDRKEGIGIFDLKFGTLQAWKPFPEEICTKPQLFHSGNHLFMPCSRTLCAFTFECRPFTVADILGQNNLLATMDKTAIQIPGQLTWTTDQQKCLQQGDDNEVLQCFTVLLNVEEAPDLQTFEYTFNKLMKQLKDSHNRFWWSSCEMVKLVLRCVHEKNFWLSAVVQELIDSGYIPHRLLTDLFDALIAHKEAEMIITALDKLAHVSEKTLAKLLHFYLELNDNQDQFVNGTGNKGATNGKTKCPLHPKLGYYLNRVLCCPSSDIFMVDALRDMSFKHIMTLLRYLYYLLSTDCLKIANGADQNQPSLVQIADWLSFIIDAHITHLIISPDSRSLLTDIHHLIAFEVQFFDELNSLEALLTRLKTRDSFREKIGLYCIETLHVS